MFEEFFQKLEKKPAIVWAITLLYMSAIFYLSSLSYPPQPLVGTKNAPVIEHFFEYAILGALLFLCFRSLKTRSNAFLFAVLLGIFYACTDELHQFFVPGRYCTFLDFFIDSLGVLSSSLLMRFRLK